MTGGIYIDQLHGGSFVVPVTSAIAASDIAKLSGLAPTGATISFPTVTYSTSQLLADREQVGSLLAGTSTTTFASLLSTLNLEPEGSSIDLPSNRVDVRFVSLPTDTSQLATTWTQLADQGLAPPLDAVQFVAVGQITLADETHRLSPGQMKSGLEILLPGSQCTSNLDGEDNSGHYYLLSAGHCGYVTNPVTNALANGGAGESLGSVVQDPYRTNESQDVLATQLPVAGYASPYAWAYIAGHAHPEVDTISVVQPTNQIINGDQVCMNGASQWDNNFDGLVHCGAVQGTTGDGYIQAGYYNCEGDSGGLVGLNSTGFGINHGLSNPDPNHPNCGFTSYFYPLASAQTVLANLIPGFHIIVANAGAVRTWTVIQNEFGSNFCMDVAGNNPANGTTVWGWGPCNAGPAEQWSLVPSGAAGTYVVKRFATGGAQCLDADVNGPLNGAKVQEWQCNGTTQQEWVILQVGTNPKSLNLLNLHNTGCLDMNLAAPGGGYTPGTPLQTWSCLGAGQLNQLWYLSSGGG